VNTNKTAAVGIEKVDLGMPTCLPDLVNLEAGRAQLGDSVSEWRAH